MTDRELLEKAARAAGIQLLRSRLEDPMWRDMLRASAGHENGRHGWNPLTDDGDALRLAVQLDIHVRFYRKHVDASLEVHGGDIIAEHFTGDHKATATRRAIARAAAALADSTSAKSGA